MLNVRLRRWNTFRLGREGLSLLLITMLLVLAAPATAMASAGYGGKAQASCGKTHHVAAGETLSHIAQKYGVNVKALAKANGLKDADFIVENQKLCIPVSGKGYGMSGKDDDPKRKMDGHVEWSYEFEGKPKKEKKPAYGPRDRGDKGYGMSDEEYNRKKNGHVEWSYKFEGKPEKEKKPGYGPRDRGDKGHGMSDEEYNRKMYGHVEWSYEYEGKPDKDKGKGYPYNGHKGYKGYGR